MFLIDSTRMFTLNCTLLAFTLNIVISTQNHTHSQIFEFLVHDFPKTSYTEHITRLILIFLILLFSGLSMNNKYCTFHYMESLFFVVMMSNIYEAIIMQFKKTDFTATPEGYCDTQLA